MSVFGAQITQVALPLIAVTVLEATAFQIGILAAVQYLPFLVIGLPAGVWVDRLPRRAVMIVADLVRFVVLLIVPAAAFFEVLQLWLLYPVAFFVGAMTVLFDLAAQSFLPVLIGNDRLVEGNTKLQISQTTGQLAGPGVSGFLVQTVAAPAAILVNALTYAVSGLLLRSVRVAEKHQASSHERSGLVAEVREGLRYVFKHPLLRPIALSAGIGNLFGQLGMIQALLVLYAVQSLRLSMAGVGGLLAFANAGLLLGSLLNAPLVRLWGVGTALVGSTFLMGLADLLLPLATPDTALILMPAAMMLSGICTAVFNVNQISLRQAVTPESLHGRMTATLRFVVWGVIPVGTFLGGALAEPLGHRSVLVIAGLGSILAGLPLLFSAIRLQREMPTCPYSAASP